MKEHATLQLHTQLSPFLNIALYLNDIKPIQTLIIENDSDADSGSIEVKITADPPCVQPFEHKISFVSAQTQIQVPLDGLKTNREFLNRLSETEKADLTIEVIENQEVIIKQTVEIEVQPLEYFGGFSVYPELIATYITPNHPYVYHIKKKAIQILEKKNLRTAFEGYQSGDPERVLQMMSAIYSAIQSEEIVYSSLPPGYEETGQRLRLLNTIQHEKFGNCIDISLLFAACLEAVDLNPILIIVLGHAFVGCWLQDDKFTQIINDDKAAITKRLSKGIREIAAVEATSVCKGQQVKFSDALNQGEAQLIQKEDFLLSVDLKAARALQIRPLPLLTDSLYAKLDEEAIKKTKTASMEKHFDIGTIYEDDLLEDGQPKTKQKIWERKLLDLSLRNNLLNLRMTRNMLQLIDIDINELEDNLADGKSFSILPNPRAEILKKYNLFTQPLHHSSPLFQLANEELKHKRLLTHYHQQDLDHILAHIFSNAKQSIEESGASTLYLGVGLLKWFDRKTPDRPRFAPILLLPVEMSRRSVQSKFTLKSSEEETMINITLIEFLRQEYELDLSGLQQLPTDENGVDVAKVMGIIRRAIMQLKGWDVDEQLVLGNFSFNKLILWKDIVDHEQALLKSDMVRSLVEGKLVFSNQDTEITQDIDEIQAKELIIPIPTDVSQTEAILAAQRGESFVLHGPPGTGKSQTITNIIADSLYHGKRVLFVAAKKAALDVVQKRLEQIGLAPFVLELHSNKTKKSHVLAQLEKSIETAKSQTSADFQQEAARLDAAKNAINSYVKLLHQKQKVGWSLYDSIAALENQTNREFPKNPILDSVLNQLTETLWRQWTDWLPQYQAIAHLIIHPKDNPLSALQLAQYSLSIQDEISSQTEKLIYLLKETQTKTTVLADGLFFPFSIQTKSEWENFAHLMLSFQELPDVSLDLIHYLADKENYSVYEEWSATFSQYQTALGAILKDYNRNILNSDISTLEMQWKQARQKWFLPKWLQTNKIKKLLSGYRNDPYRDNSEIEQLFTLNNQQKEAERLLAQSRYTTVQQALKNLFKDEQTDLTDLNNKASAINRMSQVADSFGRNTLVKWIEIWQRNQFQYSDEIKQANSSGMREFIEVSTTLNEEIKKYENLTAFQFTDREDWKNETVSQLQNIQAHLPHLKDWMNYTQLRKQGESLQAEWLIGAYEDRICKADELVDYFHFTVHTSIAQKVISEHEELSIFNANLYESKIEHYKKIAKDFQQLTIEELRMKLALQLPNTTLEAMQSSEIGILQRAIKNRGRGLSIRKLFDQIPTLLPRIAPCMLMSPISVAQYFDANTDHFDILIFDEASQLPTSEAVSALARAKQAIVVGDPKQMPPTSFFSANKMDEEDIEVEDLESILDDCLSLSVPSKYLLRHYRSKHESLISFSNVNFYESKLLTFPSSDDSNRKVKLHRVEGYYDKGKTRTNKFEAAEIVEYIKSHYHHPERRKLSLGVVTFSQAQLNLIENLLFKAFVSDPKLEEYAYQNEEPLFIKNLENVQGDERDIILFSIGYAPDEEGKMSMNFGPINREGGWRRLNVAVTRSRYEMHIFSTLKSEQIDLSRTTSEGVASLKAFLNFAENGYLNIRKEETLEFTNRQHLSESIAKKIMERGYDTHCNIGTSGFKVDIGIVHPEKQEQYILGIVIDGHYYYDAQTTNDRERVIPSVLKNLGWNIHRIWTVDWYENPNRIIDALIEKVENLKNQPEVVEEIVIKEPTVPLKFMPIETSDSDWMDLPMSKQMLYIAHDLTPNPDANSENIYEYHNRAILKQQFQKLVETEAPISKSLLFKKVMTAWNVSRAGSKLSQYFEEILADLNLTQTHHHQTFYWPDDHFELEFYRSNDIERRNMEDIAPEEILIALEEVITNNLSIEEDELLRYLARTFGFAKVGNQIERQLRYSIDFAIKNELVKRENNRIKLMD